MVANTQQKLKRIELEFDDGYSVTLYTQDIERMNEVGKHLKDINDAIATAKWLASLRTES